jgi:SAM-dependent methyltransferase
MTQPAAPPSPLSAPEPWDLVADAYTIEVAPMFESFAQKALRRAEVGAGMRVADVAAGPGTLSFLAAQAGAEVSALDFSEEMVKNLRARIAESGERRIEAVQGDGQALPWADASFDAGFSMFGLMFFPDRAAGFRELARVLKPGGKAVVSSWVDMSKIPMLAAMFGTFSEAMPVPASPLREFPLVEPDKCRAEMTAGGFTDVVVEEGAFTFTAPSTEELADSMIRTNAPIALARAKMGDGWPAVEARWRELLAARLGAGPHDVTMTANLIYGVRI